MTDLLRKAFDHVASLNEREQDEIARWLLAELESGRAWGERFENSQNSLSTLACEALHEHERGETKPLDPDAL